MIYIFWLYKVEKSILRHSVYNLCAVNQEYITIYDSDDLCRILVESISDCNLDALGSSALTGVKIVINPTKHYKLIPVNPLTPGASNELEAKALCAVIQAYLNKSTLPDIDPHPYKRQMSAVSKPPYAKDLHFGEWNAEVSPIFYLEKYNPPGYRFLVWLDRYYKPSLYVILLICGGIALGLLIIQLIIK